MISNKSLYKIHSWLGLNLGLILFVVCFSGTIAVFSSELDWLSNPDMRIEPTNQPIAWQQMYQTVKSEFPNGTNLGMYKETYAGSGDRFATVTYVSLPNGQTRKVYLNPYSGVIQGHTSFFNVQRFFRTLHRRFFDGNRGIVLVTFTSFFLLFSVITGFLFYKGWLKNLFTLRIKDGLKRFFSDAHKLAGIWTLLFGLLIALTGVFYFTELMINASEKSEILLPESPPPLSTSDVFSSSDASLSIAEIDQVIQNAEQAFPELEIMSLRVPIEPTDYFYVDGQAGNPLTRNRANKVYLHPLTGEVAHIQYSSGLNTAEFITDIADPLHFGTFCGTITKILWFLFGLALCFSVLSGTYIWQIRASQKNKARKKKAARSQTASAGFLQRLNQQKSVLLAVAITLIYFLHVSISTVKSIQEYSPQNTVVSTQAERISSDSYEAEITKRVVQDKTGEYVELELDILSTELLPIQSVQWISKGEDSATEPVTALRRGHPEQNQFAVTGLEKISQGQFKVEFFDQSSVMFSASFNEDDQKNSLNRAEFISSQFPESPAGVWITIILFSVITVGIILFWAYIVVKPVL